MRLGRIENWPSWLVCGWAFRDTAERVGSADSGDILLFGVTSRAPGLSSDEVPWCAAFVGSCLERVGIQGSRSLMAKSYKNWGRDCPAQPGAIAVYNRTSNPALGHVGFVVAVEGEDVWLLSGNVSNRVKVDKRRKSDAIAYRWPLAKAKADPQWAETYAHFVRVEGGLTNDPNDSAGLTLTGLIKQDLVDWLGRPTSDEELKEVQPWQHEIVIRGLYWYKSWADLMPPGVSLMYADIALLQGRGRAALVLQETADIFTDGEVGPKTIEAAQRVSVGKLSVNRLAALQRLSKWSIYAKGWTNRANATLKAAIAAQQESPTAEPDVQPPEPAPMPEAPPLPTPKPKPEAKPPIIEVEKHVPTPKPEDDDRMIDIDVKINVPNPMTILYWTVGGFVAGFLVCKFWDKIGSLISKIF